MSKKSLTKEINKIREDVESLQAKKSDIQVFVVQGLEQEQRVCQELGDTKDKVVLIRCY